jgi:16S rRNA (guanine966-N2)-methyltransferase
MLLVPYIWEDLMRISGGNLRGREISTPGGTIRPTQEKVRAAIFSAMGDRIVNCRFLDLYAGSGIMGLEALSRGADYVCWVETNPRTLAVLADNVNRLFPNERQKGRVVRSDAERFLRKPWDQAPFDIVFADPPYKVTENGAWLRKALQHLEANPILRAGGLLILEERAGPEFGMGGNWRTQWDRTYGDTRVRFLEKTS